MGPGMMQSLAMWCLLCGVDPAPIEVVLLDRQQPVSFEKEIEPILAAKCQSCHSAKVLRGGLDMGTYAGLLAGGKSGPAIVPGKSTESRLIQLAGRTMKPTMPPTDETPLTPHELALVKLWIDQGAIGGNVRKTPADVKLSPLPARVQPVRAIAISPDKSMLAFGRGNKVHILEPKSGKLLRTLTAPGKPTAHESIVEAIDFAPDGKTIASASFREVIVWNPDSGEVVRRITGFADRVVAISYSPDGKFLATGGGPATANGELRIVDLSTGKPIVELSDAHSDTIFGVAFSSDGSRVVTGGADKLVKVWNASTGEFLKKFEGHSNHVLDVGWKSDGRVIASAGADDLIKVWDVSTGEVIRTIRGHGKQVTRLVFIGASNKIFAASGDFTARVWNVDNGGSNQTLRGARDFLYAIAASKDGQLLATGGEEGIVRLYSQDGRLIRSLEP